MGWFSSSPSLSSWWTRLSSSLRGTTRTWRSGNSHHQSLPFTASNFPASIPLFLLSQPRCAPECQSFLKYCFKSSKNPSEQSNFLFPPTQACRISVRPAWNSYSWSSSAVPTTTDYNPSPNLSRGFLGLLHTLYKFFSILTDWIISVAVLIRP